MARKNKSPPLSYSEKYRQIKQSGFNVDIPKPTDSYGKSLVTRYHRILFGGFVIRHDKRVHTFGLAKSYAMSKSNNPNIISALKDMYKLRYPSGKAIGMPRIKNGFFPREFKAVQKVSKNFITFKTKTGTYKILRATPKQLYEAATDRNTLKKLLSPLRKRDDIRIFAGAYMRDQKYNFDALIDQLMKVKAQSETALLIYHLGGFTFK